VKPDTKEIRHAMAVVGTLGVSREDIGALCDRVEALEAALVAAVTFIEDDTCRHDHEKREVLRLAFAALEAA